MANTLRKFYGPAAMPTSAMAILTVPANTKYLIKYIVIVNTDTSNDRLASLWVEGTTDAAVWIKDATIYQDNGRYEFKGNLVLEATNILYADSDSANVNIAIYGVQETS
jgi:hypothetical protein